MNRNYCWAVIFLLVSVLGARTAIADINYKIVTGSDRGTYIQIGRDLAKWVAPDADIDLQVVPSKGSTENVQRLRQEAGVKFALVQSDVYQALLTQAAAGNRTAARLMRPLRVMLPLYNEEIYFVVRADSPLNFIDEIKDRKINVGPVGSGTALSATTLYRLMYDEPIDEANASYLSNEDALVKLTTDQTIDVVVIVAGQPAKLFADMKPQARQFIKLLRLNPKAEETARASSTYFPASIRSASYPHWLSEDVPTLTVKAMLVTYDYDRSATRTYLNRFARSLCRNFGALQKEGHPKWKEVTLRLPPLGKGWAYHPSAQNELRGCSQSRPATPVRAKRPAPVKKPCSQTDKVLGLCSG